MRLQTRSSLRRPFRSTLVLGLTLAALAGAPRAEAAVMHGSVAPNFTKTELGGGPRSLSEFSGKVVVLFFLGYG